MTKFKVGDLVQAIDVGGVTDELNTTSKYTVLQVYESGIYVKNDLGGSNTGYYYTRFKLVDPTLTPEEVFNYLRSDVVLERRMKGTPSRWITVNHSVYVHQIDDYDWRVKPVPQTIDYYGTEIPKPVTKEEAVAEGLATVYRPQLIGEFKVQDVAVGFMQDYNLYFRTESEASQVVEVLLKPFK